VLIVSAINWPVVMAHIHKISLALDEAQPGTGFDAARTRTSNSAEGSPTFFSEDHMPRGAEMLSAQKFPAWCQYFAALPVQ
jgi:hypothetical protein